MVEWEELNEPSEADLRVPGDQDSRFTGQRRETHRQNPRDL